MNIIYWCMNAHAHGIDDHPQTVMARAGIQYQHATPQSIGEQWWFWNCSNLPTPLPAHLTELKMAPSEAIGFGLDAETAAQLTRGTKL